MPVQAYPPAFYRNDNQDIAQAVNLSKQSQDTTAQDGSSASLLAAAMQQSQIQQLLQQQMNSTSNAGTYLQHQQLQLGDLLRGQMAALQERLQLNLVHQTQLMQQLQQCRDKKLASSMQVQIQHLSFEQQQLVQQIQTQQRHYLMQQSATPPGMSPTEVQKLWENLMLADLSKTNGLMNGLNPAALLAAQTLGRIDLGLTQLNNNSSSGIATPPSHPLYQHGMCAWPSCEAPCDSYASFIQHLNANHTLDERNTAQCRVQMQVVEQLEAQMSRERQRLTAMMQQLQMKQSPDTTTGGGNRDMAESPLVSPTQPISPVQDSYLCTTTTSPTSVIQCAKTSGSPAMPMSSLLAPALPNDSPIAAGLEDSKFYESDDIMKTPSFSASTPNMSGSGPQISRRRVSDKASLPIAADIARNREFYRTHDVRPPYTYASLIRQAVMEAKDKQLTLNEIYTWFQETFAYFRRNAATWKNAVRHNLSLHKCFTRVENVKGAVWTVDDNEYYKRRPQRVSSSTAAAAASIFSRHSQSAYPSITDNLSQVLQEQFKFQGPIPNLFTSPVTTSIPTAASPEETPLTASTAAKVERSESDPTLDAYIQEEPLEFSGVDIPVPNAIATEPEPKDEIKSESPFDDEPGKLVVDESAETTERPPVTNCALLNGQ